MVTRQREFAEQSVPLSVSNSFMRLMHCVSTCARIQVWTAVCKQTSSVNDGAFKHSIENSISATCAWLIRMDDTKKCVMRSGELENIARFVAGTRVLVRVRCKTIFGKNTRANFIPTGYQLESSQAVSSPLNCCSFEEPYLPTFLSNLTMLSEVISLVMRRSSETCTVTWMRSGTDFQRSLVLMSSMGPVTAPSNDYFVHKIALCTSVCILRCFSQKRIRRTILLKGPLVSCR